MNRRCFLSSKNVFKNLRGTNRRIRLHRTIGPPNMSKSITETTTTLLEAARNVRVRSAKDAAVVILSRKYGFVLASMKNFDTELRARIEICTGSLTRCRSYQVSVNGPVLAGVFFRRVG